VTLLPDSPRARWLLALAACVVVVLISTRISREMTLWGIVASVLLLIWLWQALKHPPDSGGPSDPETGSAGVET
jgi:cyanate permease